MHKLDYFPDYILLLTEFQSFTSIFLIRNNFGNETLATLSSFINFIHFPQFYSRHNLTLNSFIEQKAYKKYKFLWMKSKQSYYQQFQNQKSLRQKLLEEPLSLNWSQHSFEILGYAVLIWIVDVYFSSWVLMMRMMMNM